MKSNKPRALCFASLLMALTFILPASAGAEVNVSFQIGLPPLVIPGPPGLVVIPNTYVYYPPEVDENIFFYHGHWYRPHHGHWFKAPHYNGPWDPIIIKKVPRPVISVPAGYRYAPAREHVPYGQVKKNWRKWERNHHWKNGRRQGAH